ncbi:zinc-dependent metalloprotease [Stackebrandtia soli]|uniref:zinc-dependent metalloprotease n=1 Tax=Stackebrandtia soli TaxID=1892856 RepID=UPI0039EB21C7
MQQMMAQLQQMMSQAASSGPVNWDLAKQLATSHLGDDPAVSASDRKATADALRLADLWLEEATTFPSGLTTAASWTRREWLDNTTSTWRALSEPLAEKMTAALSDLVPEDVRSMLGPMANLMQGIGSSLFGAQVGQAMAELSKEVLSSTEVGLPLGPAGTAALLPGNLNTYAEGFEDVGPDEVRLYVSLRETAHHRLYGHVPWLRAHVIGAVEAYAAGIHIDRSAMESLASDLDLTNADAVQHIDLTELFRPEDTPAQRAALARLEHMLALIGGWVTCVATEAAGQRLPTLAKLAESARRRRATGGPTERTFSALVGLKLSPKKLREATVFWEQMTRDRGVDGRDALWAHPDLMPTQEDVASPGTFAEADFGDLDMSIFDQLAVNDPREEREEDTDDDNDDGPEPPPAKA